MQQLGTIILVLACSLCCLEDSAHAQIEGFVETFTGDGPFFGMNNPGWGLSSLGGDDFFTDEGFSFTNLTDGADDLALTVVSRRTRGGGSFIERIELRDIEFTRVHPFVQSPGGSVSVMHRFDPDAVRPTHSDALQLRFGPLYQSDSLLFDGVSFSVRVEGTYVFASEVATGPDTVFEIHFDAAESQVTVIYDNDVSDESQLTLGPFPLMSNDGEMHYMETGISGFDGGGITGLLSAWSLTPLDFPNGDFNRDSILDAVDIELLTRAITVGSLDDAMDLDGDDRVAISDLEFWLHELFQTYFGDSNLDGEFNSADLVNVFVAGEYEDAVEGNSTWATGDWTGNGEFDSADLVLAFQDGGYELGPREAVRSVPEPNESGAEVLLGFLIGWLVRRRRFVV